ncbi:MAG: tRNA (adenine-N1)-methyltransferase [Candidatus Nanoarchaeia archaeon]
MKLLITDENKIFPYKGNDIHTKWGCIRKEEIQKAPPGSVLKTNKDKELYVIDATFRDLYSKIKQQAQVMLPKDISAIIGNCGITKKSRVLDSGTGSGGTSCFLASVAKHVYSYELRKDHAYIAKKNLEMLGLNNVTIKQKDVTCKIDEKKLHVVILDLPEPWLAIEQAKKALAPGGWIVSYSPNLTQVKRFVSQVTEDKKLLYTKTIELIEREWEVEERKLRPKYRMLGHTGFLTFTRKI